MLTRPLLTPANDELSDRELLRRFAAARDEDAFALLVRRHGPMVHRVALRALGNGHDADDVFQAAFLVLAQNAAALSGDNRRLATGGRDTTVLVWDATGRMRDGRLVPAGLTAEELRQHWDDLGADGTKAHAAVWALVSEGDRVVAFLAERLGPVRPDAKQVAKWVAELGDTSFKVRVRAAGELEKLGDVAEPALQKALAAGPALETKRRLEHLLQRLDGWTASPHWLRPWRAIEALEQVGTAEARRLLERLAGGVPESEFTRAARAASSRLSGR